MHLSVIYAYANLLDRQPNTLRPAKGKVTSAITLLVLSAVVFRAELILLVGAVCLQAFLASWVSFRNLLVTTSTAAVVGSGKI